MDAITLVQFSLTIMLGLIFTVLARESQTVLSYLIAAIIWLFGGAVNFVLNPAGIISFGLSMIFWVLGALMMAMVFWGLICLYADNKHARFESGPL